MVNNDISVKGKNKFLYLLVNEVSRGLKLIITFLSVFFAGHIALVIREIFKRKNIVNEFIAEGNTVEQFVSSKGQFNFTMLLNNMTQILIMWLVFGILAIMVYSVIIWTREWYGNNKTIYTLMTIPTTRHSIILSKFLTVLLIGTTYISTQIVAFCIDNALMKWMLGPKLFKSQAVFSSFFKSRICNIFPNNLFMFTLLFLILSLVVLVVFNIIMLTRSYKLKGVIISVILVIAMGILYIKVPKILELFVGEMLVYNTSLSVILIVLNYISIHYLLDNKVQI